MCASLNYCQTFGTMMSSIVPFPCQQGSLNMASPLCMSWIGRTLRKTPHILTHVLSHSRNITRRRACLLVTTTATLQNTLVLNSNPPIKLLQLKETKSKLLTFTQCRLWRYCLLPRFRYNTKPHPPPQRESSLRPPPLKHGLTYSPLHPDPLWCQERAL